MTVEEAVKTAIDYEIKVRDAYLGNLDAIKDAVGRKVFEVLGEEEQGHVDYLQARLAEWQATGHVTPTSLSSVVPSKEKIAAGMRMLKDTLQERDYGTEREMLAKALKMEQDTSAFYRQMVSTMDADGALFERFLEIEEGHEAIVQAELDYLNRTGTFFDFQEFNLEH